VGETTSEYRMLTENPSVTGMIVQKWIGRYKFNSSCLGLEPVNIMKLGVP